ncbi:Hsp70 family protein [Pseudonocardia sp. GCM10023141]|uniref:Hsp70 family protein n=1 Tax=Pseudonocardia sp. GCM10023141 TaxID=3252653 RepID=UPI00361A78E5
MLVASVLFVEPDGTVVVGEVAQRRALTDPRRVVRGFQRRIGDPTPIVVAGQAWAPQELSAWLIRWVVDRVAAREGGPADRIVVTHPASWGAHKCDLLTAALAGQGLTVTLLAEPLAAVLHYTATDRGVGGSTIPDSAIAVYDLGGTTFDAAVIRTTTTGPADPTTTTAAAGAAGWELWGRAERLERLGGADFDEAVFEHVREGLHALFDRELFDTALFDTALCDPAALDAGDGADLAVLAAVGRLRQVCTQAKETLSSDTEVVIPVPTTLTARARVRLHRSEFESVIRPRVEETVAVLDTVVASAGLAPAQLTAVVLVGGSARIPLVAQLVSAHLGRPVFVDPDPATAIAKGAALVGFPTTVASRPGAMMRSAPTGPGRGAASLRHTSPGSGMTAPTRPSRPVAAAAQPQPEPPPAGAVYPTTPRGHPGPGHEQRRRARLVMLIGMVCVVTVIAAVLLWPGSPPTPGIGAPTDNGATTATPTVDPVPAVANPPTGSPRGNSGSSDGDSRIPGSGAGRAGAATGALPLPPPGGGNTTATPPVAVIPPRNDDPPGVVDPPVTPPTPLDALLPPVGRP